MQFLLVLLILLVATRACGELAVRLGQPALVGELVAGILLGAFAAGNADVFPALDQFATGELFRSVIDLAIFFLMLLAGIEMRPEEIAEASVASFCVALGGVVVPLGLGVGLGWIFLPDSIFKPAQALFLGTALSITAVPVAIKMLMDLNLIHSRVGEIIVSAAIFDDVLGFILLACLTAVIGTGDLPGPAGLAVLAGQVLLFLGIVTAVGMLAIPRAGPLLLRLRVPEADFSLLLIAALAYSVLAEALGMHFILGAFAAGLFFGRRTVNAATYERIKSKIAAFTTGFLAPLFFASIGFRVDLAAVVEIPAFTAALIVLAVLGKLVGAALPAYWLGIGRRGAMAVGVGMSARGAVELIVADVALRTGLFTIPAPAPPVVANLFSAVVLMAVVSTVFAPVVLRQILSRPPRPMRG